MFKNNNIKTKEYRYTTFSKAIHIVSSFATFLIFGGVLFFLGTFGHLKYIVWIPFLFLIDILTWSVWYLCKVIYCVDTEGFSIRNVSKRSKKVSWDDIQKVRVIKYGSKTIKLDIFEKGKKRLVTLDTDIHNYKELFEIILANAKEKVEEKKKIFFIVKPD